MQATLNIWPSAASVNAVINSSDLLALSSSFSDFWRCLFSNILINKRFYVVT
jgi:hypothetical protein